MLNISSDTDIPLSIDQTKFKQVLKIRVLGVCGYLSKIRHEDNVLYRCWCLASHTDKVCDIEDITLIFTS